MENKNKKSLSYMIKKNPFLLLLFVIVISVALLAVSTLITSIQKKVAEKSETTESTTIITTLAQTTKPESIVEPDAFKKYAEGIKSVTVKKDNNDAVVQVEFKDDNALLDAHYNSVTDIIPIFYFYVDNGSTQVRCPGEFNILKNETSTAIYRLSNIDDFTNAIALTDKKTVTIDNILSDVKFNVFVEHKKNDGVGKTILGTYPKSVEQFNKDTPKKPAALMNKVDGVKNVDITMTDEFIWLDIYFKDLDSYNKLNLDLVNNFVSFGFVRGGINYKRDFIITEYDSLNMIRCKFDSFSVKELSSEMGVDVTIPELFKDYNIAVWTSDYDKNNQLFCLNGTTNVLDSISKGTN